MESLVHLIDVNRANIVVNFTDNICEVGGSVEFAIIEGALIAINNRWDTIDSRIKDIAIKSEAVRSSVCVRRDGATKAIEVNHLVLIIELKDVSNALDSMQILIAVRIHVMQGLGRSRISI